jgi:hypothetical protein
MFLFLIVSCLLTTHDFFLNKQSEQFTKLKCSLKLNFQIHHFAGFPSKQRRAASKADEQVATFKQQY